MLSSSTLSYTGPRVKNRSRGDDCLKWAGAGLFAAQNPQVFLLSRGLNCARAAKKQLLQSAIFYSIVNCNQYTVY